MHEDGLVPFLQLIGPSTSHQIFYRVPYGINVLEALDNSDSKTNPFNFVHCQGGALFKFLAQSNQARYVERMRLDWTEIGTPNSLQSLTSLTRIELNIAPNYEGVEIYFTSYLS